jgi:hypothetical protein
MSTPNATGHLDLDPWQVGDLRLTAFPSLLAPSEARTEGKRWEALVGKKPENAISRNFDTEVEENGPFLPGGTLSYRRSTRVMQWMLERAPTPDKPETYFWMNPQVLMPFKDLMCWWLIDCPPLQRLAFGAALYLPVKDREEGYHRLRNYLPFKRDNSSQAGDFLAYSPQTGDFLYQFNRRRSSHSVTDVEVNRLSKWTWLPLELRATSGERVWPVGTERSACLLELDINTAPEFQRTLPPDRYVPLFEELVGLAVEIAARGDVP